MDAVEYSPEAFFFILLFLFFTGRRMKRKKKKKLISEIFSVASSWPLKSSVWPPAWSRSCPRSASCLLVPRNTAAPQPATSPTSGPEPLAKNDASVKSLQIFFFPLQKGHVIVFILRSVEKKILTGSYFFKNSAKTPTLLKRQENLFTRRLQSSG